MKNKLLLISLFSFVSMYSQQNFEYQMFLSGFQNQFNKEGNIYRTTISIQNTFLSTIKKDSLTKTKIGFGNINQFVKNEYNKSFASAFEHSIGFYWLKEKEIRHFSSQNTLAVHFYLKHYHNNMNRQDLKGRILFPGIEYTKSYIFPLKNIKIGPFLQILANYRNIAYQDYIYDQFYQGFLSNYFNINFKIGVTIKL
jgi:hypothetical protein